MAEKNRAAIFVEPGRVGLDEDLRGECRIDSGLAIGHEQVGIIENLGTSMTAYQKGAITPSGGSFKVTVTP